MKLKVDNLETQMRIWEGMAQFEEPLDEDTLNYLNKKGFADAEVRAIACMGWMWCQWLQNAADTDAVRTRIGAFVERGMEMQKRCSRFEFRAMHDLYLLHCAIFGSSEEQLTQLAKQVVDGAGYKNHKPEQKFGEMYASAWCGMLKYWILGEWDKAVQQSDIVWGAYRDASFRGAAKPLVVPWLKRDWDSFVKKQQEDFEKRWEVIRKDGTVRSENRSEVTVDIDALGPIRQMWCWAHAGMAVLAHRRGAKIASDPFWLPPAALKI